MALLPIDLQTVFAQLSHVGNEQASLRGTAPIQQMFQGAELANRTEQRDHSVNGSQELGDGVEDITDQESTAQGRREESRHKRREKAPPAPPPEPFTDPALGRHVDVTG